MSVRNSLFALAGATALAFAIHGTAVAAVPTLAPYPAPGGNTESSSGTDPATGTGLTWTFGGFNNTAYDKLYYTVGNYVPWPTFDPTGPTLTMDGSTDQLSFNAGLSDLANGIAVWSGSTVVSYNCNPSCTTATIDTHFTLSVTDTFSNPLTLVTAASTGLGFSGAMLDVQGDFKANWLFTAQNPTASYAWQPSLTMFDSLPKSNGGFLHQSSVGGAFYYTPPVPEPSSWAMMAAGLAVLAWLARRRPLGGAVSGGLEPA